MSLDASASATNRSSNPKPLLIYDGKCKFCIYWVNYWQKLTSDKVIYRPYQEAAADYPTIPIEAFQRAVQYVAPDGKISSAAAASFLTLSHAPDNRFWLLLYRRLPGFAFIAEKTYALIASHRTLFYFLSVLLWGRDYEPPRHTWIAWIFLRLFGLICLIAFFSFGTQALGLIGSQGISPLAEFIDLVNAHLGTERYWQIPMVFWLDSSDTAIQTVCWSGVALSVLLSLNIWPRICLFLIYILYLSLCYGGQVFMTFQWDIYLLETSIIAIILVSYPTLGIWLLRWLLFRFIFEGGLVKIMSGDPAWQNLTTLQYYFETEPLPTPLAWYAAHLPQTLLTFGTAATLVIELFMPFLIFFPRRLRFVSAFAILLLQITILITGNYNFFNLLTILLCLVLFDDAALKKIIPDRLLRLVPAATPSVPSRNLRYYFTYVCAVFLIIFSVVQFNLRSGKDFPAPMTWIYHHFAPFVMVNMYGPFAVITTTRMEIVVDGSYDGVTWKEYNFKYKPGDVNRPLTWNIPFQPRLDWQMWFAALGTAQQNPWFVRFLQRLLENSPTVLALLEDNPFPDKPPLYIRAEFYEYHFTTREEREKTGAWWTRHLMGFYVPMSHL